MNTCIDCKHLVVTNPDEEIDVDHRIRCGVRRWGTDIFPHDTKTLRWLMHYGRFCQDFSAAPEEDIPASPWLSAPPPFPLPRPQPIEIQRFDGSLQQGLLVWIVATGDPECCVKLLDGRSVDIQQAGVRWRRI